MDFIGEPGHLGDELAVFTGLNGQQGNLYNHKNRHCISLSWVLNFHDTVPKAHKKVNEHKAVNELNDHEPVNELNNHNDDPFKRHTRSMGHARIPITPSPGHQDEAVTKPKCKQRKRKPKIKIIKERKYGIHCRWKSTNRKCSLCHETFKSARELSAHVKKKHKYKFLCKFQKCQSVGYALKNSVDRHSQHYSLPCHICATCGKQFHKKYNLEALLTPMILKNSLNLPKVHQEVHIQSRI